MLSKQQERTCQAIVNIFETGSARGDYGQVTVLPGDTGHLTYGRAQTTLASGNLYLLLKAYVDTPFARHAAEVSSYLPALESRDLSLDSDAVLHETLREAGDDPIMQKVQDDFFDRVYWAPALRSATAVSVSTPLGVGVVYDSHIHGSWHRMRDRTIGEYGAPDTQDEKAWITAYVDIRSEWLRNHTNQLLRRTVYRMDSFRRLISDDKWQLTLPLDVRGVTIDDAAINDTPPVRVSADESFGRLLRLREPAMRGDDVEELQMLLTAAGHTAAADGVFGPATDKAVRSFQEKHGLVVDGIVGPATLSALLDQ
jgi:chitosanase